MAGDVGRNRTAWARNGLNRDRPGLSAEDLPKAKGLVTTIYGPRRTPIHPVGKRVGLTALTIRSAGTQQKPVGTLFSRRLKQSVLHKDSDKFVANLLVAAISAC